MNSMSDPIWATTQQMQARAERRGAHLQSPQLGGGCLEVRLELGVVFLQLGVVLLRMLVQLRSIHELQAV